MSEAKALTKTQQQASTIAHFLNSRRGAFRDLLPKHLTPEKMVKGVLAAATRNPKILQCTQQSVLNAVLISASLGLEIGRPRGGMYLVPFKNNKAPGKPLEVVAIPDYRGLMDLAFKSGRVLSIEARPVYAGDEFKFQYGTESGIEHTPALKNRGDMIAVYAVAHIKDARPVFQVMSLEEVNEHRARSRAKDDGPWVTDYTAMALKTVVKGITNWLPQNQDDLLDRAAEYDTRAETGEGIADLFDVIEVEAEEAESSSEKVISTLQQGQGEKAGHTGGAEQNQPQEEADAREPEQAQPEPEKPKRGPGRPKKGEQEQAQPEQPELPEEGERDASDGPVTLPDLHPDSLELMRSGGTYAAAMDTLNRAYQSLNAEKPTALRDAFNENIQAVWGPKATAKELEAINMLYARRCAEAADIGYPQ